MKLSLVIGMFFGVLFLERTMLEGASIWVWNFDKEVADKAPQGFTFSRTGYGKLGQWIVQEDKSAPTGTHVLAQLDSDDTNFRFPVAVANDPSLRNLRLSVRCKPVSGKVDQACGLVFRYYDQDNYYLARANALEDNVRFYYVKDRKRIQLASWSGRVSSGSWHEFRADAKGDHFEVYWDGKKVIDAQDPTFQQPGKVGVWTKADSVTYFDDLTVVPLEP